MTTDPLAVSKPVSWACLEKFQNLCRAFGVNDLSNCGGAFNSASLTVARARGGGRSKAGGKMLVWEELCEFFVTVATESAPQSLPKFPLNRVTG